jgi:tryptophan-rich sensory protein
MTTLLTITGAVLPFLILATAPLFNFRPVGDRPGRPPPWVFSVVWPAICVLLSLSWLLVQGSPVRVPAFGALATVVGMCIAWMYVYQTSPEKGAWVLGGGLAALLVYLVLCIQAGPVWNPAGPVWNPAGPVWNPAGPVWNPAGPVVAPIIAWFVFALILNMIDVQYVN